MNEEPSGWITALGTFIAIVAFFRPELTWLWRRWRNRIDFFPLGKIEIGFSTFGPTLGILGTIRSAPTDQFVKSVAIEFERESDRLTHQFEWAVFRPTNVISTDPKDMHIASGFVIKGNESRTINVQFFDNITRVKIESPLLLLREKWFDYLQSKKIVLSTTPPQDIKSLYDEFTRAEGGVTARVFQESMKAFYWERGVYKTKVEIKTWDPAKTFLYHGTFEINDAETERLRLNIITLMYEVCGIPGFHYNFVNPTFTLRGL